MCGTTSVCSSSDLYIDVIRTIDDHIDSLDNLPAV